MKRKAVFAAGTLLCCVLFFCACAGGPQVVDIFQILTPSPTPPVLPTPVPEPPLVLNMHEGSVYGGGVIQLAAYETPGRRKTDDVRWTSSDETVAVVEEYGVVIGLAEGEALITAENAAGDAAVCRVTITSDRPQPRQSLALTAMNCRRGTTKLGDAEIGRIRQLAASLSADAAGERIALSALRYVGNFYGVKEGNIDCSMLLLYACLDNGGLLPRRSDWQAKRLETLEVKKSGLRAGDFLFFAYEEGDECSCRTAPICTRYLGVHHAAVYLGQSRGTHYLIEASSVVGRVVVRAWDGSDRHAGLQLVLCTRPDGEEIGDAANG